jgi:hypothetical protein
VRAWHEIDSANQLIFSAFFGDNNSGKSLEYFVNVGMSAG